MRAQVRTLEHDDALSPRRSFLQRLAAQGVAIPAAYFAAQRDARAHQPGDVYNSVPVHAGRRHIVRDFAEPYIELIRLLRQATEIEHALMVQYLYGAFSVKPHYAGIVGSGLPNSNDLLGVSAMEMQHLRDVNGLLIALGAAPSLERQGFPFEPEVYPFEFNLEPLTEASVAKYVYCEAAAGSLDRERANEADRRFLAKLDRALGTTARPNHVGSLYDAIIHTLREYIATAPETEARLTPWIGKLEMIKLEGEDGHFQFFRRVFMATHDGFKGRDDAWICARNDPAYPSYPLPVNPTAFIGEQNLIRNPEALGLAWLADLHYWLILLLAEASYSEEAMDYAGLARMQMLGPFLSLARHLPKLGAGVPFDPLVTGYGPCPSGVARIDFISCMVREADRLAVKLKARLPEDYPVGLGQVMLSALNDKRAAYTRPPGRPS
ncbi:hypothetical protein GCM10028796_22740 [Ramlibacter monticola]|uniref:Iminophenyl-pyruvate dimer synthase domain-containing protein n=1 Tax=Ramlibacter monticola TaxID=1926872 RepID=A0A936YZV7_9BURK|nr:hypothetical protein [Ramlibacter monticola]